MWQHCWLSQFYLISTCLLLAQPLPISNETATELHCDIGGCECYEDFVECHLKDCNDEGLHLSGFFNSEPAAIFSHSCESNVITKHSVNFAPITNRESGSAEIYIKRSELTLENCLRTPAAWTQDKLYYNVQLQLDRHIPRFSKTHRLWELMPTSPAAKGWLPVKLTLHLNEIKYLELAVACDAPKFVLPLPLFHSLHTLEVLVLHFRPAQNGWQTIMHNLKAAHFRDLAELRRFELGGNWMRALEADLFTALTALERLNLSRNALQVLPAELLVAQKQLITLDLSDNLLQTLPNGLFNRTVLLEELHLANNRLCEPTNMIESMRRLFSLRKLDLSYNRFETLHGTGIYENATLLAGPHKLQAQRTPYSLNINITINLSHNRISRLSFDWVEHVLDCFYHYDLSHNNITHVSFLVPPLMFASRCPRKWSLAHNPLQCDCQLAWLSKNEYQFDATDWLCATPSKLSAQLTHSLPRSELCNWLPNWCPQECTCSYDTAVVKVNCTNAQLLELPLLPRPEQVGLRNTILLLNYNKFYRLPSNTTFGYANVSAIYIAHNRLTTLHPSHLPSNLTVLDLRANNLERLSDDFLRIYLEESATLQQLYLSDNPWLCDCAAEQLLNAVHTYSARIPDVADVSCANLPNATLSSINYAQICHVSTQLNTLYVSLLTLAVLVIMLISAVALFYKYNSQVKIWLYAHQLFLCFIEEQDLDKHKTFDAFISYAHQQHHYVNKILIPGLEQGDPCFRICTHERNWLAGAFIPEQIVLSVEQSRRTIIVLSQHFVESDWGRMEFRTAHQCALNERRSRIIIIKYGELTNLSGLDKELQAYLKMNTYLEWNDTRFWDKLRYAMPHKSWKFKQYGMLEVPKSMRLLAED